MSVLRVREYPQNDDHVRRLIGLCRKVMTVCDELGIRPILGGSMAVFIYTFDRDLAVYDLDLSCSEECFPDLQKSLEARSMSTDVTEWRVLQVRDEDLKVEFDSQEKWMSGLDFTTKEADLYGLRMSVIDKSSLQELYRRGVDALAKENDPNEQTKSISLRVKYALLDSN